ncbi:hypothetical protein [Streptomyces sp. MP131-18]|uniref:hypothetical protein n=1 Tax=Streptomyces sp. MP131-18 TaxID=1857892 RepID=UPI0009C90CD9|nr:hypothetical protein [Streptomyces sp. MP131-18]ONK10301.1 hypothetical protein STBA_10230 [Streptomyces sp. MP131-18]
MSTPVNAEQAWNDLQRIRVPQERVYDEVERRASGAPGVAYAAAALMWVFLAGLGLGPPRWVVLLALAAYVALLSVLTVRYASRSPMQLHHSRYNRRMSVTLVAGVVMTGATAWLSGRLAESLEPVLAGLVQATVSAAVFLLFIGPASRWAAQSLRGHGEQVAR